MKTLCRIAVLLAAIVIGKICYAGSVLVEGDVDLLTALTYTDYLDGHPAIFFSEQQVENGFTLESKVDDLLITEGLGSLILDLVWKRFSINLDKKGNGRFDALCDGWHEVWTRSSSQGENSKNKVPINHSLISYVRIDDTNVIAVGKRSESKAMERKRGSRRRWVKLVEILLERGNHEITLVRGESMGEDQLLLSVPLIVIPKKRIDQYRQSLIDVLKQTDVKVSYLLSCSPDDRCSRDWEDLAEDSLEFEVVKPGDHLVQGLGKPREVSYEQGMFFQLVYLGERKESDLVIAGIKGVACSYEILNRIDNEVHIKACFDEESLERQFVRVEYRPTSAIGLIEITEDLYVGLTYEIEDPQIQRIALVLWVKDTKDERIEKPFLVSIDDRPFTSGLPITRLVRVSKTVDIPSETEARVYLTGVDLDLIRNPCVDRSKRPSRTYTFHIKDVRLLQKTPVTIKNEQPFFVPKDYSPEGEEAEGLWSGAGIPQKRDAAYHMTINPFVDLAETPSFDLTLLDPKPEDVEEYEVRCLLDFDGGGFPDGQITKTLSGVGEETRIEDTKRDDVVHRQIKVSDVNIYNEARSRYPHRAKYHLLGLYLSRVGHKEEGSFHRAFSMRIPKARGDSSKAFEDRPAVELDGMILKAHKKRVGEGETTDFTDPLSGTNAALWVDFGKAYLREGTHTLRAIPGENWDVDMIYLKPVLDNQEEGRKKERGDESENPVIEFEKINPTRYLVRVRQAERPFWLVFSESFHEGWKAYVRREPGVGGQRSDRNRKEEPWSALVSAWQDRGKRVELKDHFLVNGYANAWWMDPQKLETEGEGAEEFEIVLEFKPQRLFEIGIIISALTLAGCVVYIIFHFFQKRAVSK